MNRLVWVRTHGGPAQTTEAKVLSMTEETLEALETASAALEAHHLAAIAVGVAFLIAGWLLYRLMVAAAGLILGVGAGIGAGSLLAEALELESAWAFAAMGGCAVLGAIVGVVLFRMLHALAFFLFGAVVGGWIWVEAYYQLIQREVLESFDWFVFLLWLAVSALSVGMIFAVFHKHVISIASALIGAVLVTGGLGWPWYGSPALPLFVFGLWLQLKLSRRMPLDEDE